MAFNMKYPITAQYLPVKTKRRSGKKADKIRFIVAHDTGNPSSTAKNNVDYYTRSANEMSASAHTFIDDKVIIECIPATLGTPEKAWHVLYDVPTDNNMFGYNANDAAIGVELCYGGRIDSQEAYKRYIWYMAYLCYKFDLTPDKIVGHNELDPRRKSDPYKNSLKMMGITKEKFLSDVRAEYEECTNGDDMPMQLADWEKQVIIEAVNKWSKKVIDGKPVINSPQVWIDKVNSNTITAGELSILNMAIMNRAVK